MGPAPGPAAGLRPSAPANSCAPARLWVPSRASPPALSGSVLLSHPPLSCIPCCATWSPQGQGVTNCQVRGGHLESAAWGWSHGEGSSVTPLPAQTLRGPAFPWKFLHCPTLRVAQRHIQLPPLPWEAQTTPRARAGSHPQARIRVCLQGQQPTASPRKPHPGWPSAPALAVLLSPACPPGHTCSPASGCEQVVSTEPRPREGAPAHCTGRN